MTAEPVREGVSHLRWVDSLAWMERMSGTQWRNFVDAERRHWEEGTLGLEVRAAEFEQRIRSTEAAGGAQLFRAAGGEVAIAAHGTMAYSWRYREESYGVTRECADLDAIKGGHVWAVRADSEGKEQYTVEYYFKGRKIWSHRGVGPFVAVLGKRVYCIESKNSLVYWRLVSWSAASGKDRRVHYEEHDPRVNLSLSRCGSNGGKSALLLREAGGAMDLAWITEDGALLRRTVGGGKIIVGDIAQGWFEWAWSAREKGGGRWEQKGWLMGWKCPPLKLWNPEWFSWARGILVCIAHGERSIWRVSRNEPARCIWRGLASMLADPWDGPMMRIQQPGAPTVWWNMDHGAEMGNTFPLAQNPAKCLQIAERFTVRSHDGTHIPYVIVYYGSLGHTKPRGLLVIGYSAYGLPTGYGTARWQPLLDLGWAICIGMFRGGGDHSPAWAEAGRRTGRERTLQDAVTVVEAAQKRCKVGADKTVLYGRSAGGLWVGGVAALYPRGTLCKGIYMEVPYLDVLRTTSNPALPLTQIETEEFGRADLRISDFEGMLKWSPMELLGEDGAPRLYQLVRSGENDQEVFAYEPAKWILRSRGPLKRSSSNAYFILEPRQGHFASGDRGKAALAIDAALIDSWVAPQ
jgi:hypothetical protein